MTSKILFSIILSLPVFMAAQVPDRYYDNRIVKFDYFTRECCNTQNISDLKIFLEKQFDCELSMMDEIESPYSRIITFKQVKNGIDVYEGYLKIILDSSKPEFCVYSDIFKDIPVSNEGAKNKVWQPELELTLMKPGPPLDPEGADFVRRQLEKGQMGGVGLAVDDCRKTFEELVAKGVAFVQEPSDRPYGVEAVMRDVSGNWLVLVENTAFTPSDAG